MQMILRNRYNDVIFREIVNLLPDDFLQWQDTEETPEQIREVYFNFLVNRLRHSQIFVKEAENARG